MPKHDIIDIGASEGGVHGCASISKRMPPLKEEYLKYSYHEKCAWAF